jgi:hypothetical protein
VDAFPNAEPAPKFFQIQDRVDERFTSEIWPGGHLSVAAAPTGKVFAAFMHDRFHISQ